MRISRITFKTFKSVFFQLYERRGFDERNKHSILSRKKPFLFDRTTVVHRREAETYLGGGLRGAWAPGGKMLGTVNFVIFI